MRKLNVVAVGAAGIALTAVVGCDPVTGGHSWSAVAKESAVTKTVIVGHTATKVTTLSLDGKLVDSHGQAIPGTAFHEQCQGVPIAGIPGLVPVLPCTLALNSGSHVYGAASEPNTIGSVVGNEPVTRPVYPPGFFWLFGNVNGNGTFAVNKVGHPSAATYDLRIIARPN
jgi:hypothetical protein